MDEKNKADLVNSLLDAQLAAGLRGDFEEGWRLANELETIAPEDPRPKFNRAWYEMMRGNLLKGFELLSYGRWIRAFGDQPLPTNKSILHPQDSVKNKHILFCSEGGLGDEIINFRFTKVLADLGAKVTVSCDPGLVSVLARVPWISAVVHHQAAPFVFHDHWIPGMSAGHILGVEYQNLSNQAYLSVDPESDLKWRQYFENFPKDKKPRIGLRFKGNSQFEHEQFRKFPEHLLVEAVGKIPWVSLQLGETDLAIENWEDTLAVINNLDLIITSCTSVAHAAAALGKETWVVVPVLPYYVWAMPGAKSPWYESVTLFRQKTFGQWEDVFTSIGLALNGKF